MSGLPGAEDPRLFDLCAQLLRDVQHGPLPPLAHYLSRFPGIEADVEREYRVAAQGRSGHAPDTRGTPAAGRSTRSLLDRLIRHPPRPERYAARGEIGHGGMGVVHEVFDGDLRRSIAMKVVRLTNERAVASFFDEAQITGQLDHPGIVPVHELGVDEAGNPFFTMRLVRGRTLAEVFRLVDEGSHEWTRPRALNALLRVCEAMAYAHRKGVIHRDLKPSNVMCGEFGEVYVMDWGLARVQGPSGDTTHMAALNQDRGDTHIRTTRVDELLSTPDSPLATQQGDVVGTPNYMPPEQAAADREGLGARSDVYSVGAMLYQLLCGRAPYSEEGRKVTHTQVLARVLSGPPAALHSLRTDIPAELAAICEKAMAREQERRYPDMSAMAEDLRAFLEQRVVSAYRVGAWQELEKWCRRNRTSAALAALAALLAAGTIVALWQAVKHRDLKLATQGELVRQHEIEVQQVERGPRAEVMRDCQRDEDTLRAFAADWIENALYPRPDRPASRGLRARGEKLLAETALWDAYLRILRTNAGNHCATTGIALPSSFADGADAERRALTTAFVENLARNAPDAWSACLARARFDLERARAIRDDVRDARFPSRESRDDLDHVTRFVTRLLETGAGDARIGVLPLMQSSGAGAISAAAVEPPAEAWNAIQGVVRARYDNFELAPQTGLVPLGLDPASGLCEFAHAGTGAIPERRADGTLALNADTCVVLVLLPSRTRGADRVEPLLVSKHELTWGQWLRAGNLPSDTSLQALQSLSDEARCVALTQPVVDVTWRDAALTLRRCGLSLPTEAEWQYAAGTGTNGPGLHDRALDPAFTDVSQEVLLALPIWCGSVGGASNPFGLQGFAGAPAEWTCELWRAFGADLEQTALPLQEGSPTLRVVCRLASGRERSAAASDAASRGLAIRPVRPLER